jgi:hypothetical protein
MHTKQVSKHNKPEHNGQWFTRLNSEAIRIEKKKKKLNLHRCTQLATMKEQLELPNFKGLGTTQWTNP